MGLQDREWERRETGGVAGIKKRIVIKPHVVNRTSGERVNKKG